MIKYYGLIILVFLAACPAYSQSDSTIQDKYAGIFDKLSKGVKDYRLDTTGAPGDKLTGKIIELRNLRGGFNINEAIDYKLEEDRRKNEMPREEFEKLSYFLKSGNGKRWLDNAVIWIYRQNFTYKEIKQLVKFYQTSAGQKMADNFPVVMMQTLTAAETIKNLYDKQH